MTNLKIIDIEGKSTDDVAKMVEKIIHADPEVMKDRKDRKWMQDKVKNHLVELHIKTDMEFFPLVKELRKHLQAFMDENHILNDPMVFITTEYREVQDNYTDFKGIENGSGYREWCSYDKGEGY